MQVGPSWNQPIMRPWRRTFLAFLIAVFALSTMLAAMPLVWCVGDDGHRGVEYSLSADTKHIDHQTLAGDVDPSTPSNVSDCQDWQLLGKAKVALPDNGGIVPFALREVTHLPTLPPPRQLACPLQVSFETGQVFVPDKARDAMRTTVLLI
jgi:hypothetical protein